MGQISIIDDADALAVFFAECRRDEFPGWDDHPLFGDFARRLYPAVGAGDPAHIPCSFAVLDDDAPLLLAAATCNGIEIGWYGLPMTMAVRAELGKKRRKKVFAAAFEHLESIAEKRGAGQARIVGGENGGRLGEVDLACLDRLAQPSLRIHAIVDATVGETEIHRNLRDSYRSLVNWGREQLSMAYVNAGNPDDEMFQRFPAFHAVISGRPKDEAYWRVFWQEVESGRGEVSLGFLDNGDLVSATMVADAGGTAYYASGVYDRSRFDKPLGHFPVFDAMIRAGGRGVARFDLGEIVPRTADADDKEVQIGFFKKGFTADFALINIWTVRLVT